MMRVLYRATRSRSQLCGCSAAATAQCCQTLIARADRRYHHLSTQASPQPVSFSPCILDSLTRSKSPTRAASLSPSSSFAEPLLLRRGGRYHGGGGRSFGASSGAGDDSHSSSGRGSSSDGGKGPPVHHCPHCGESSPLEPFLSSTSRYMKCSKCDSIFEQESFRLSSQSEDASSKNRRKPPPPPKKIYSYLDKFVVGQEKAKKVLSVAVYNHYKRVHNNIPSTSSSNDSARHNTNDALVDSIRHREFSQLPGLSTVLGPTPSPQYSADEVVDTRRAGSDILDSDKYNMVLDKSNIVMLGPTGSGKTLLAQTLARCLDVPFAICDCTTLTQAGYVGEDVETVIAKLLQDADGDVEMAQQGMVFLDEIDKIGAVPGVHQLRDVGGEGVQQGMLKLIEGTLVSVSDKGAKKLRGESISVDTTNILFVASGAFNGLDKIVSRRTSERFSGFGSPEPSTDDSKAVNSGTSLSGTQSTDQSSDLEDLQTKDRHLSKVEAQDLISFGMIPEFVGRFPIITSFHNLTEDMLIEILTLPKNALVPQFQLLFNIDKVALDFTDDALREVAKIAQTRKTGARGLRAILENILLDTMFEVPGSNVIAVTVDKAAVLGTSPPRYTYSPSTSTEEDASLDTPNMSQKKKAL
ncbi:ATP-dependent Clp protease ATP-binding subunit clpX-like, mitochondrial [Watersipora subatra]|uniref:ATP-dependent Clp protease ATP-binding subunit clpX-like, mitochondrial n=1 Tax=Watersipora subatra TaxID=2589382 RepID=UPI00355BC840